MSHCKRCSNSTEWLCQRHAEELDEATGFHSAGEILEEVVPELYQEAMQAKTQGGK